MTAMAERVAQDWEREAIDLKRQGLVSNDIAEAVGKSPSTVRKVIARAREAGELPAEFAALTETQPCEHPECEEGVAVAVKSVGGDNYLCEAHADEVTGSSQANRMWPEWYRALVGGGVPPEDDPEYDDRDPLEDFRAEAGEAVGPMPPTPPHREMDEGEEVDPPIYVKGTRQMALDFGENAAMVTGATLVLKSEKLEAGHFGLGDVIHGTFTARIVATTGAEKLDKDIGEFVAKPTAQVALVTEFKVVASSA